jgi:hypothetical protein
MFPPEVRRMLTQVAPLLLFLQPCRAFASDLVFSGNLERVGHESISVKLADRRVIDARLPNTAPLTAGKIAAEHQMGDQVQIICKAVKPVWEEETSRYQSLEVTKLRLLGKPSPEEVSKMFPSTLGREGVNLLSRPDSQAPLTAAIADGLEHAREVNLAYTSSMPNFVADETAKRYTSDGSSEWRYLDTIETEITFKGSRVVREQIRKDGRPWERPFQALPGFKWSGGFGSEIRPLFDTQCPTTMKYEGRTDVRGKQLLEYSFSSPPDGCFGPFYLEYQRYNPARTGHIFIEDPGGHVIQLTEDATGFPPELEFVQRKEEVSWDYVKIGETSHLLPVGATFTIVYSSGKRWRVEAAYTNHRHFEASTNVTFK